MPKILSKCAVCKKPIWIKVTKDKKIEKEPHCQSCKNFMNRIKQRMWNAKRKELKNMKNKNYKPEQIQEPSIKSEVQKLIKKEAQEKFKEIKSKPLNTSIETINNRKGKASNA